MEGILIGGCVCVLLVVVTVGLGALFFEPFEGVIELILGFPEMLRGVKSTDKDVAPRMEIAKQLRFKAADKQYRTLKARKGALSWTLTWELRDGEGQGQRQATTALRCSSDKGAALGALDIRSAAGLGALGRLSPSEISALTELWSVGDRLFVEGDSLVWIIDGDKVSEGFLRARLRAMEALARQMAGVDQDRRSNF